MNPITLYGIPNCDTVKKARAYLAEQKIDYVFHDFKKQAVPEALMDIALAQLGSN
jgi:arsenate reductase (glutaredoxin)